MEKNFKRTTVTSALPYANGPVHIGHLAGVYVPADIYVRYLRLKKQEVLFIGGLSRSRSRSSASRSTCTGAPHRRYTIRRHRTSSVNSTTRASSSRRPPCNIMTRRRRLSWPTATSRANAPAATPREHTATSARSAARRSAPRN